MAFLERKADIDGIGCWLDTLACAGLYRSIYSSKIMSMARPKIYPNWKSGTRRALTEKEAYTNTYI